MSKRKVVMFDLDGVLAYFQRSFYDLCGGQLPECGHSSNLDDNDGITKDMSKKAWDRINQSKTFWYELPLLCSVEEIERVSDLSDRQDVYFVTGRPKEVNTKLQTERWLQYYGVNHPSVILSSRKGEIASAIGANFSIEDKAGNAAFIKYMNPKGQSFLVDRPYNRFGDCIGTKVIRVKTVTEFLNQIGI